MANYSLPQHFVKCLSVIGKLLQVTRLLSI